MGPTEHARWLLFTGRPGINKTTVIRRALQHQNVNAGGFFTEELREGGTQTGFRIKTLDGRKAVFARRDTRSASQYRVGAYAVDMEVMASVAVPALQRAEESAELIVVDEIGKVEILCPAFTRELDQIAEGGPPVLGTILSQVYEYADRIKPKPFVDVIEITPATRAQTLRTVQHWLEEISR